MNKLETINKIKHFLDGHNNDVTHLVNIETSPYTNYAVCYFHLPNNTKVKREIYYESFLYVRDLSKFGIELYPDRLKEIESHKKEQYGITIKKLRTDNQKKLEDGYCYKFSSTRSFDSIIKYIKDGGIDLYEKEVDENGNIVKRGDMDALKYGGLFYKVKPTEQFLISTGIRFYKGIEEYNKLHRVTFDIETTGLRYQTSRCFAIGIRDNMGFEKIIEAKKLDNDNAEKNLITEFFKTIVELNPVTVAGYNSEDFDFDYIFGRSKNMDLDLESFQTTLDSTKPIRRSFGSLKYGSTTEKYVATKIYGVSVIDIHHAAKKTAAINSEIKNTKLKYICQYEGVAKSNRVYIKADDNGIGKMYYENKIYLTNKNYEYIEIPDEHQETAIKLHKIQTNKKREKITDNQFKLLRKKILTEDKSNFVKWIRGTKEAADKPYFISGRKLIREYLKDDLWETEQVDELYNQSSFMLAKMVPTTYERVCTMGTAAIWELLLTAWSYENDLAIPHSDERGDFSGGLARCFKSGFTEDIIKIDYNSLYPMIQLTNNVFPMFDIMGVMKMILTYSTTTRNIYKKIGNNVDLDDAEMTLLRHIDTDLYYKRKNNQINKSDINKSKVKQLPIKILNNSLFGALGSDVSFKWSDNRCAARITCIGRLELRHVIKWFSDFGCVPLLAVTDGVNFQIPHQTNIKINDGGINVQNEYRRPIDMWEYNNKKGVYALIEKFNKEEMTPPYMSIDDDGSAYSVLNLYRINYAMLFKEKDEEGKIIDRIKLTGNTIKSKTMPEYIEEFINKGLRLILNGKGKEFVDYYYDYIEDIFYKRIPLKKIASKSKMKTNINGYLKRGKDKNGRVKAMQAHMELIIEDRNRKANEIFRNKAKEIIGDTENYRFDKFDFNDVMKFASDNEEFVEQLTEPKRKKLIKEIHKVVSDYMPPEPELDTTIYYVNTGYRKSHGEAKQIKDKKTGKKRLASKLINPKDLIENPNMLGNYNIDKYLTAFNKRIESFLVGFSEEVREKIPAKIKRKKIKNKLGVSVEHEEIIKNSFTGDELILKNYDHDSLDDSLYLEKKEVIFWNNYGYDPNKIWNGFKTNEGELKSDYIEVLNFLNEKMREVNRPAIKRIDDDLNSKDMVLIKDYNKYHIGVYDGVVIKILKYNIKTPKTKNQEEEEDKQTKQDEKLKKLKIENTRDTSNDERYFKLFKKKFNVVGELDGLSMDEFFVVVKEAEKYFKLFVEEQEEKEMEEYETYD